MFNTLIRVLAVGVMALGMWQAGGGSSTVQAHHVGDTYDCDDFPNQAQAQGHFNAHPGDQDNLDHDGDDIACEQYNYDNDDEDTSDGTCSDYDPTEYYNYGHAHPCDDPLGHYPYQYPHAPALIPAPSRPSHISLTMAKTSIGCNEETAIVARLVFPNGAGASSHLIQFQSTLGTVFSNVLTDPGGYAQSRFIAPSMPAQVQITAFGDGLVNTQTINVTCAVPQHLAPQAPVAPAPAPQFSPPKTGEAGLASSDGTAWLALGALVLVSMPVAIVAVARQRN